MAIWDIFSEGKTIKKLKERLQNNSDDAEAHFCLAAAYEEKGRLAEAIDEFNETVRLNPKSAEAHFNLGILYEKVNDGRNAIIHILKAGNLFGEKGDANNKERSRKRLRDYYQKFGFQPEDFAEHR
ncbi:MAG: hypothetical protein NPINA01_21070 [Nitrospinaceae bacterium]|nr:MAG: hypothetical protein NPINA01_21070 [Nitrospinaceae bacterium]